MNIKDVLTREGATPSLLQALTGFAIMVGEAKKAAPPETPWHDEPDPDIKRVLAKVQHYTPEQKRAFLAGLAALEAAIGTPPA